MERRAGRRQSAPQRIRAVGRAWVVLTSVLALNLAAALGAPASLSSGGQSLPPARTLPAGPEVVHTARAARQASLTLVLRGQDPEGLAAFLRDVQDPASLHYHRFLTPAEFGARFGAAPTERDRVLTYLRQQGLTVERLDANSLTLSVRGPAERVENAFQSVIASVRAGDQPYLAGETPPSLPVALSRSVEAVLGLEGRPTLLPQAARSPQPPNSSTRAASSRAESSLRRLVSAYRYDALRGAGLTGRGRTVALVSMTGFDPNDLARYARLLGITDRLGNIERRPVDGGARTRDLEGVLVLELTAAMLSQSRIMFYDAPNSWNNWVSLWAAIINDNQADVISCSWGQAERLCPPAAMTATHRLLEQAAAQEMTVFAASGNGGAFAGKRYGLKAPQVLYPASDPLVVGVGGTSLGGSRPTAAVRETAWWNRQTGEGSGGGTSEVWPRPDYQQAPELAIAGANEGRQVPDVALHADPRDGYTVIHRGGQTTTGGTSAATPMWAAGLTLILEALPEGRLGAFHPLLYRLGRERPAVFGDVREGTNGYYAAGPGWDFTTGWGSADFGRLRDALVGE